MKKIVGFLSLNNRYLLFGCFLFATVHSLIGFTNNSFFRNRPQGVDAAAQLVGWQTLINRSCQDDFYGAFYIAPHYSRTFDPKSIANFLFGSPVLTFSGSRVPNRSATDLLADYFALPSDYVSKVCFEPSITNFIMDLNFYFGLDDILSGLYVRIDAPVTFSAWNVHMNEYVKDAGVASQPAGYLSRQNIPRNPRPATATIPASNGLAPYLSAYLFSGFTVGDMVEPLNFGKIGEDRFVANRIAGLSLVTGWNYTQEDAHAGLNFRVVLPTDNRPTGEYLFEALAGNAKHWDVGVGFTSHYDLWVGPCGDEKLAVYFDANFSHLFTTRFNRSYDFIKNGPGSRYILLEEILSPSRNLFLGDIPPAGLAAANQYQSRLYPAINKTTLRTDISIDIQADLALKFSYQRQGLGIDLGYGFYGRSRERLHCRDPFLSNRYAIKGDAQLYGFDELTPSLVIQLNATQSNATLQAGQGAGNANFTNANADSPELAFDSNNGLDQLLVADATTLNLPLLQVNGSNPAVLLQDSDINEAGALLPRAILNKFFFHLGHVWLENSESYKWSPFIGIGGEVEWAGGLNCKNSAPSEWGIWLKGGVAF